MSACTSLKYRFNCIPCCVTKMFLCAVFSVLIRLFLLDGVKLLDNGVARTPPMGWMSWGYYMCGDKCDKEPHKCLNESLILSVADKFIYDGFYEAGYEYIIIDDCWSEKKRNSNGRLVPNKKRFPNGMKYIGDYLHKHGLKFGMYTNIASVTCMYYPGSKDHFKVDAETFAEWGVDYIKVDGCYVAEDYLNTAYIDLGRHLNATGRSMLYSCSWPYYITYIHNKTPNYMEIMKHCNMWRNYHDVALHWPALREIITYYEHQYHDLQKYHGPGHWNDPDMLIFGTGTLTDSQSRVHIAVYSMLSAPLLLSCDMSRITLYEKELLQNLELVAIAQDPLGIMARPYNLAEGMTVWIKPHLPMKGDKYHSFSFAFVNFGLEDRAVSVLPAQYGLNSTDGYTVMDVFTKKFLYNVTLNDKLFVNIPSEDVVLYSLYPL